MIPLLVAALLCLPTLPQGYWTDDYMHNVMIEQHLSGAAYGPLLLQGRPDPLGLPNLFGFFDLDAAGVRHDIELGAIPWWTWPELHISFWRPLSSALALLDHQLFGRWALPAHVHSALWYLGLVGAVGLIYRRAAGGLAGLALLLFAIDDVHWLPMGWLANRNALVAAVPALLGLAAHLRWREQGWRPGAALGPLGVAVGATGGEAFLGVMALFFTYELLAAPGAPARRALHLAPPAAVALVWALAYKSMGFGASGSGLYMDPVGEPLRYLAAAAWRAPVLLGAMFGGVASEMSFFMPSATPALAAWGLICVAVAAGVLRAAWPDLEPELQRGLRWLIPGSALAMLPVLATFPLDRLLLVPSVGGSLVIAAALRWAWRAAPWPRAAFGGLVAFVHVGMPLPMWAVYPLVFGQDEALQAHHGETAFLDPASLPRTDVVLVNASDMTMAMYFPVWWLYAGHPTPRTFTHLSPTAADHRLTRTGPRRFELELLDDGLESAFTYALVRGREHPIPAGTSVRTNAGLIEVLEVGEAGPDRVAFTPDTDPDSGDVLLISWVDGALVPLEMPAVGESVELRWTPGPRGM